MNELAAAKVAQIAARFTSRRQTLALAESCTGGLVSHLLTELPGASKFFKGAVVCYANDVKESLLGVKRETLASAGAVSAEAVAELAVGVRHKLDSDIGLAISGIAGPTGGSIQKPVGTVFMGWSDGEKVVTYNYSFQGMRSEIKTQAALKALEIIEQEILK